STAQPYAVRRGGASAGISRARAFLQAARRHHRALLRGAADGLRQAPHPQRPSAGPAWPRPAHAFRKSRMSKRVAIIGSGFGGLALAIRLQSAGIETTILEARDKPGGRAYYWEKDG